MTYQKEHPSLGELKGGWEALFKIGQIMSPIFILSVTIVIGWLIIPWAKEVNNLLAEQAEVSHLIDSRVIRLESWAAQGPRFTQSDADKLKLEILSKVSEMEAIRYDRLITKIDALQAALQEMKLDLARHTTDTKGQAP